MPEIPGSISRDIHYKLPCSGQAVQWKSFNKGWEPEWGYNAVQSSIEWVGCCPGRQAHRVNGKCEGLQNALRFRLLLP